LEKLKAKYCKPILDIDIRNSIDVRPEIVVKSHVKVRYLDL